MKQKKVADVPYGLMSILMGLRDEDEEETMVFSCRQSMEYDGGWRVHWCFRKTANSPLSSSAFKMKHHSPAIGGETFGTLAADPVLEDLVLAAMMCE